MAAAAAATGGAAVGGANPSGDGGPKLRSPPGKGSKPAALADITNTGKPNPSRSISVADLLKENAKLIQILNEKTKTIDHSRVEIHNLRLTVQILRQQNQQLAQTNSQMNMEISTGKDRIKALQHELSCKVAVLKVKGSEVELKNKAANQRRKELKSQEVLEAIPSKVAAARSHRVHGSETSGVENQLVESQTAPSNFVCQEPSQDAKKRKNRKSESNGCIQDTNIMQGYFKPRLQPVMSSDYEEPRKPQRRRSSRMNHISCEIAEVSHKTSHQDIVIPSGPSIRSVEKQRGHTIGNDMSLQNECSAIVHKVLISSEEEETEINEEAQMEANLKEIQEDSSMVTGVDAHQIDVTTCYPTQKPHMLPVMSSDYEEPRKPERRRSSRLNHVPCEITEVSHKTSHENTVVPAGLSILSVHKQHGQTIGNDMRKSLQNERSAIVHEVLMSSEEEEIEVNDESQKEANLKETHEACSRVIGDDAHQIDVTACNTTQSHSSAPFMEIIEPSKSPVATGIRRSSNKQKLALCEAIKTAEDLNSKCDTTTSSKALCQEKKRKSRVKDSVTLNSVSSEDTNLDALHEDFVAPLASSNLNASVEQKKAQKQNDSCSSTKYTEGRRSLRRAAEKVISYKEIPLNVKMRRP